MNMLARFTSEIDALFSSPPQKIAVAVSGGADSFALLHLTQAWAQPKNISVLAMTVDHGLRPESRDEAQQVGQWCKQNAIAHETLHWTGEKPASGIQAKARVARRDLLCRACAAHDIPALLLGHQADDQAETMLMRLQRGSGLAGLKAMQKITRDKETKIRLLRPLLAMRRTDLRHYCLEHQLPFIDDPSNENHEFERIRIRALLANMPELANGIAKTTLRLARADAALDKTANEALALHTKMQENSLWLPANLHANLAPEIYLRLLQHILSLLQPKRITVNQAERLAQLLDTPNFSGCTLAGIQVRPKILHKTSGLMFQAEPPRSL
ncbi:MAG: tRNA lysidine(34) synthetase TilS [Alphaproteobacteria bacterium]|nr:tRNA lysidine(34) synthetase TilS [Alphaproteobacteria bacterium]